MSANRLGLVLNTVGAGLLAASGLYGIESGYGALVWDPGWWWAHLVGWSLMVMGFGIQIFASE